MRRIARTQQHAAALEARLGAQLRQLEEITRRTREAIDDSRRLEKQVDDRIAGCAGLTPHSSDKDCGRPRQPLIRHVPPARSLGPSTALARPPAMGSPRSTTETYLEQASRHVAEGRERIRRQQAVIERLAADGGDEMLEPSRRVLAAMLKTQELAEQHLAFQGRRAAD